VKVLHIYRTYFPDPPGGLQEAIRQIAAATQAHGVEAKIFALSPEPVPRTIQRPEGLVVRSKSWAAPASCDLGGIDAVQQYRAMANWADLLHFHFPWPFGDVLRLLCATDKPALMTYHSDVVRQKYLGMVYGPLMKKMLRSMALVVATSPAYVRSSLVLNSIVPQDKVKVIPLGIGDYASECETSAEDTAYLASLGLNGASYCLSLGVLRYYKGLHTLVAAAPTIHGKIVIAGSGPEMERLKEQAAKTGAANVIFTGQVSVRQKITLLRGCRALVLPSHLRSEAFGMVLVEAAMFSKPMVSCEIETGTSYVNEHGKSGFVVRPNDPRAFAEATNQLMDDAPRAVEMGKVARRRYEDLFAAGPLGSAYADAYTTLLTR
jgi:rhamnosyl/mannosyltransferase